MLIRKLLFRYTVLLITVIGFGLFPINVSAETPTTTGSMDFNFLPKFVHYQGAITVAGQKLESIDTGIESLKVTFINQAQNIVVKGSTVSLTEGQFKYSTIFGGDVPGKYHIDIGPGVPERTIFDIYVGGLKATESIAFDPSPTNGCTISNCFNVTFNLVVDNIPRPTPTSVPPTPTPLPVVNPSLYSGVIIIGSASVPDGVKVFARLADYISEIVETKDGKYSVTLNPGTANYVDRPFSLVIQGVESITTVPFKPNEFISDANFLFPDFDIEIIEIIEEVEVVVPTPTPLPTPAPETIIIVATPTPSNIETVEIDNSPQELPPAPEGGGCSSNGGGSSSISIFSIMLLGLMIALSNRLRFKKLIFGVIRL